MVYMIKEKIIKKDRFVIGDFAIIVNKKSDTIRNWEERGIIEKPTVNPKTKWREYTREELICNLKKVLKCKETATCLQKLKRLTITLKMYEKSYLLTN